jgi:hypothetical protein
MKKLACAVTITLSLMLAATVPSEARDGDARGHGRFEQRRQFERSGRFEARRDIHRWGGPRVFLGIGPSVAWRPGYTFGYTPAPPAYWYFCPSYGAYYPNVSSCPEPWVPVPAQ